MKNLNPIKKAKYIEDNFRKYIYSSFELDDDIYQSQFKQELDNTELLKGPFISKNLEFKTSVSLRDLMNEGIVNNEFLKLGDMKIDRKLRIHQEKAIRKIHDGHNLIVTTGTGSGKTESFLYPIINEILNEKDIDKPGIRAIFLFPMNALVNDQFDRVRKILNVYPKIKYAFFTGNTKTQQDDSIRDYIEKTTGNKSNENELLDREHIRKDPPHLLFTNFSMLEYILLRPMDNALLNPENTDKWKFIVLDEAHVYKGALGIEVGMLLRRLQNRIGHKVQHILTSATLGAEDADGIKQIQDFGYKLTSGYFREDDILFSERINLDVRNIKYKVDPKDYLDLYDNFSDEKLNTILNKYNVVTNEEEIKGKLYDLIIGDESLYLLNDELKEAVPFYDLYRKFELYGFNSVDQFSSFIDLICKCQKKGLKIMDLRYHSFIRSVAGAFISLGNNPHISLIPREYINGDKAFEIGMCSKCNSLYIIGVIKDNKLYQNNSIDIYENYDESDSEPIDLDYFLLESTVNGSEIDNVEERLSKYYLCPKCGNIVAENQINKELSFCEHNNIKKIPIYKVDKSESLTRNNLTFCPVCNGRSKTGLIHTVSMGKESATALLTQIFFEAIERNDKSVENAPRKLSLSINKKNIEKKSEEQFVKQILSFSDSRQQASFAVKFAENNHHRLLRKRLLVELLKNNNYMPISFENAEAKLDSLISNKNLFDTEKIVSSSKQAKISLLNEILNVDGIYGGEGLGLFYFEYELINKLIDNLTDDDVAEFLNDAEITRRLTVKDFKSILNVIINTFRTVPAISYDGLTAEDRENYFAYRMFNNHIIYKKPKKPEKIYDYKNKDISKSVHGLISSNSKSNKLEKYLQQIFGINKNKADELLRKIWEVFSDENNNIIDLYDSKNYLYSISANNFTLHSYKDCKWYYCKKCKKITKEYVHGVCPNCNTKGKLIECDPDKIFENNYYRNQYINKKIERLVYKEHTAQLSSNSAKERQIEFKNKDINYLSCSTTFEMGIDIGSLENVLLRNVPPAPANYVQRAGRAGRGQDSSAFVLTYCAPTSHDFSFFINPSKMVNGVCSTPVFTMQNYKIILRHLLALSLSLFFRDNSIYFESVKAFYFDGGFDKYKKYLESKPTELIEKSNEILKTTELFDLMDGKWIDSILITDDYNINFNFSKKKILDIVEELEDKKKKIEEIDKNLSEYYEKQIRIIRDEKNLVSVLADSNLVPKYGFPTDLVELKVKENGSNLNTSNYDLTRDMQIALSEYAPDSEIMVDKNIITSRYINKRSDLLKQYYYECAECHKISIRYSTNIDEIKCDHCNNKGELVNSFITPKYGFTGEIRHKASTFLKPKRTYSSPIKYIGNGALVGEPIKIGDIIEFYTVKNDELLIINESPFFTCPKCGYSYIDKEHKFLPSIHKEHTPLYGKGKCSETNLIKENLGYSFKTDVLKMVINLPIKNFKQGISTLYALLEGIALSFEIERNDIDGIYINEDGKHVFVLFDTVPGGAGHVKRLLDINDMSNALKYAYAKVNQDCCDSACYNCLKNFKNQRYHESLNRIMAKEILSLIMNVLMINNKK